MDQVNQGPETAPLADKPELDPVTLRPLPRMEPMDQPAPPSADGQPTAPLTDKPGAANPKDAEPAAEEDTFFDPKSLPPELMAAYKGMQGSYTRKMQELSKIRTEASEKVALVDRFRANPMATLASLAGQMGLQLVRPDGQPAQIFGQPGGQSGPPSTPSQDWEPQNWAEVIDQVKAATRAEIMAEFEPYFREVQGMRKNTVERQLDESDPGWREDEESMLSALRDHPTLAKDPALLYRMSVPQNVLEARASQAALKKLQAKGQAAQVAGGSRTGRKPSTAPPDTFSSVAEAAAWAAQSLEEKGYRRG